MPGKVGMYRNLTVPIICVFSLSFFVTPVAFATGHGHVRVNSQVGPKKYYLALGDSLAYGFQPDLIFNRGYADDFFNHLKGQGVKKLANMGCPEETSNTFINGGCPFAFLHKYFYLGAQLAAAVNYLHYHAGQVSPVTLDIGGNDLLKDISTSTCTVNSNFNTDLARIDENLTGTILPQLKAALTVKGTITGDLVMMNYYDPYQNICPNTVSYIQKLNSHLASDISGFGIIVNVFKAFGGSRTPNRNICRNTWMCTLLKNIHATSKGYRVIASTFANGTGY